jgi:hypothetical protein
MFGDGKVCYSNSIIVLNFVQILIPNCWLENMFLANFETNNAKKEQTEKKIIEIEHMTKEKYRKKTDNREGV